MATGSPGYRHFPFQDHLQPPLWQDGDNRFPLLPYLRSPGTVVRGGGVHCPGSLTGHGNDPTPALSPSFHCNRPAGAACVNHIPGPGGASQAVFPHERQAGAACFRVPGELRLPAAHEHPARARLPSHACAGGWLGANGAPRARCQGATARRAAHEGARWFKACR